MRHNRKINHLSRTASHRKAMLSNMATSLIMHKRVNTTLAKAKALRKYIEPLITKSKNDTTHSRRLAFGQLHNKYAVTELFQIVSGKVGDRPGGYTRVIKTGFRAGDNAKTCFIELVDFDGNMAKTAKKTRRTRRSRGGKAAQATPEAARQPEVVEATPETAEATPEVVEAAPEAEATPAPEAEAAQEPQAEATPDPEAKAEEEAPAAEAAKEEPAAE